MKFLVLLGDGMADFPLDECGGKTPLQVANTPAMDEVAKLGLSGLFCPIPDAYPPGSDIGNLTVFGYDPDEDFTGRAPLEAVNQGITLEPGQLAFRCNLVTLENGEMRDFTAGHIATDDASKLIEALNEELGRPGLKFYRGVSYRHLAIVKPTPEAFDDIAALKCTPPHDITNQKYEPYLPTGAREGKIRTVMEQSKVILTNHEVNTDKLMKGESPANAIWLWGQGKAPSMQTYAQRFGKTGAVISAVDLVNGIGRCAGLDVIHVPGATGYLDTDYEGKVAAAIKAFEDHDFVYLHVEAPDEAGHEGKAALKIQAIEDFDSRVVSPCLEYAKERGDLRLLVAPDHVTAISTRTHAGGPVPFALYGPGVIPNECTVYSEAAAAEVGVLYPQGHHLVPEMITAETIDSR